METISTYIYWKVVFIAANLPNQLIVALVAVASVTKCVPACLSCNGHNLIRTSSSGTGNSGFTTLAGPWPFAPGWMAICAWHCGCCSGQSPTQNGSQPVKGSDRMIQASVSRPPENRPRSPDATSIDRVKSLADGSLLSGLLRSHEQRRHQQGPSKDDRMETRKG